MFLMNLSICFELNTACITADWLFLLSGTIDKHSIEVTNCFSVPHNESEDEVCIRNYVPDINRTSA